MVDRLIFILLLLFFFLKTSGQIVTKTSAENDAYSTTSETIFLHTNATTFVTGETLFYGVNCLNPFSLSKSEISKIAYVTLIDPDKKVIFEHKLFLENAAGNSDFFINPSLPSGNYALVGYTKWTLNKTQMRSFIVNISIINPFETQPSKHVSVQEIDVEPVLIQNKQSVKNEKVTLNTNGINFKKRQEVTLKITAVNPEFAIGSYSVSIRKTDGLPTIEKLSTVEFASQNKDIPVLFVEKSILPDYRGEIFSGTVFDMKTGTTIDKVSVALSILGKNFIFKVVKTNEAGKFYFYIDKKYTNTELIVQVFDENRNAYKIVLDKPLSYQLDEVPTKLVLSKNIQKDLVERSISSQIENVYFAKKRDSLSQILESKPFFGSIAKQYVLNDFNRFPTIAETITEVLKEVHFEKLKKAPNISVVDYDPKVNIEEKPIVLVDGLLLQDLKKLFDFEANKIEKVNVFNQGYFYGNSIFSGIVSFTTKARDYIHGIKGSFFLEKTIDRPRATKIYFKQKYTNDNKNERIPDFRNQLLWEPAIEKIDVDTAISFFTSDLEGEYKIVFEGFSAKGSPVYETSFFTVQ